MKSLTIEATVGAALALLFLSQGITAPFQKDQEARPAGIVIDIVHRGRWLIPADLYGEATRKPPLYYWLSALIAELRGGVVDEPGVRAVSLAAGAAAAATVMGFGAAYLGKTCGWLGLLFVLGTYGFASRAANARTDMLFTALLFAAFCAMFPLVEGEDSQTRAFGVGLLLGLAILTKGPLAMVLCGLAVVTYLAMAGRSPVRPLGCRWPWTVLAVSALIASAWYFPAFLGDRPLLHVQAMEENLGHLLPAGWGGTGEAARPFYYLCARLLGVTQPLILYLPAALAAAIPARRAGGAILYQLAFVLAVLGFFTLASSKRDAYILPALPPLAIVLTAPFASKAGAPRTAARAARLAGVASAFAALAMLTMVLAVLLLGRTPAIADWITARMQSSDAAYLKLYRFSLVRLDPRLAVTMLTIAATSAAALVLLRKRRGVGAAASVGIASLAAVSFFVGVLKPTLARERTLRNFAVHARQIVGRDDVYVVGGPQYELSYYFGYGIPQWRPAKSHGAASCASYLLVWSNQLKQMTPAPNLTGPPRLESGQADADRKLLLLNVSESDTSAKCSKP